MTDDADLLAGIEALEDKLAQARASITQRFIGQERVVDLSLSALLCGGHGLLIGLPGLGKTRLVETLSTVMGLDANRVQFTPDLMPADLLSAPDGRRDQPRQPAHTIGAAAGDAGTPGHRRGRKPPAQAALSRACHPEPDRTGGHIPPSRGAA